MDGLVSLGDGPIKSLDELLQLAAEADKLLQSVSMNEIEDRVPGGPEERPDLDWENADNSGGDVPDHVILNSTIPLKTDWDFEMDNKDGRETKRRVKRERPDGSSELYDDEECREIKDAHFAGEDDEPKDIDSDDEEGEEPDEDRLIREAEEHFAMMEEALVSSTLANDRNADGMQDRVRFSAEETEHAIIQQYLNTRRESRAGPESEVATLQEFLDSFGGSEYLKNESNPLDMDQVDFRKTFLGEDTWFCDFERVLCGLFCEVVSPHDRDIIKPESMRAILSARDEYACILPLTISKTFSLPVMVSNFVGSQVIHCVNPNERDDNPFKLQSTVGMEIPRAEMASLLYASHFPKENQSGPTKITSDNPHGVIIVFSGLKATLWGLRSHEAEQAASMAPFVVLLRNSGRLCVPRQLHNTNQQVSGMFEFTRCLEKLALICPYAIMDKNRISNARIMRPGRNDALAPRTVKRFFTVWDTNRFGLYGVTKTPLQIQAIRFLLMYSRHCCLHPVEYKRTLRISNDGHSPLTQGLDRRRWRSRSTNTSQKLRKRVMSLKTKKDRGRGGRGRKRQNRDLVM